MQRYSRQKARRRRNRIAAIVLSVLAVSVLAGFLYIFINDRLERAAYPRHYSEYVEKYSDLYGVPEEIIYAVIRTESSFDEDAVSPAGASGLMQLMPETFTWLMSKTGEELSAEMVFIPEINIKYGVFYLNYLYREFGVWSTAYAAYNAGITRVRGWLAPGDTVLTEIPFPETENYVKKVGLAVEMYKKIYYNKGDKTK